MRFARPKITRVTPKLRCVVSIGGDPQGSLYLAGGQGRVVTARQENQEVLVQDVFLLPDGKEVWGLSDLLADGRVAAVVGSKPTDFAFFDMKDGNFSQSGNVCLTGNFVVLPAIGQLATGADFILACDGQLVAIDRNSGARKFVKQVSDQPITCCSVFEDGAALTSVLGVGLDLVLADARGISDQQLKKSAHSMTIRAVDSHGHTVVSGCEEGSVNIWDIRKFQTPVHQLHDAHTHWVTRLAVNRKFPKVFVSTGADCAVHVWQGVEKLGNFQVAKAEDSVYGLAWSSVCPRQFVTGSFEGRLVGHSLVFN